MNGTDQPAHDDKAAAAPLHMVSALPPRVGLVLGQVATDQKSNEITGHSAPVAYPGRGRLHRHH